MGIILVYDITDAKTFENIKNWIRNIEENASAEVERILLGNKCELEEKRQVYKVLYKFFCSKFEETIKIVILHSHLKMQPLLPLPVLNRS